MEKQLLRKIHMEKAARMSADLMREADEKIFENVIKLDAYASAQKIFLYVSVGKEVNTEKLLVHALESGKEVYIPLCHGKGIMSASRLYGKGDLIPGRYGIPTVAESAPVIEPEALDFILVPGVCFDKTGSRLGRGGGYYDRYLANDIKAFLAGVCRSQQLLDFMQTDEHDKKVHAVVTDSEILHINNMGSGN